MDLVAAAAAASSSAPLPQHWAYGEFFSPGAGTSGHGGAGRGNVQDEEEDSSLSDIEDSEGEQERIAGQAARGTSTGAEAANTSEHADIDMDIAEAQNPTDDFPYTPIPPLPVEGLRFPSHDAAADYICNEGKAQGYKMIRPCSATKKDGVAIRQRWLCANGVSRASMNHRKRELLKKGIAPVRNKGSKKTGCTFACALYAVDPSKPLTSEWAISLGKKPVHNHPPNEPKQFQREREARQARLTGGKKDVLPHMIHDTQAFGQHSLTAGLNGETPIWERVRILECKASELDYMRQPVCSDWLFHRGNVSFARDRASFTEDYHPIDKGLAILADGNRTVSVLGIGTVSLNYKAHSDSELSRSIQSDVLHVPAARCNGISIPRWERNGCTFKARPRSRVVVFDERTKELLFSANDSSGQVRLCMAGESDEGEQPPHLLRDVEIKLTADRARLAGLAPDSGFAP